MAKPNKFRFSIIIVLLIGIWLLLPYHMRMAFIYWFPGIEDYEIFENRTIETSDEAFEWPLAQNYNTKELSPAWRDTLDHYNTIAFLVIKDDSLVYEEYWDGFDQDSHSNSFSAAKSIVSLLIGAAIGDGFIKSVEQPVGDFIPHFKEGKSAQLKIKDLLTMSSGSNWDESYSSPLSMTTKAYYGNDLKSIISDLHVVDTPGKTYSYKSGDTQLLAEIVRAATGEHLGSYASKKLWKPLGAKNEALWSLDKKDGYEKAYCCFNSNARDFALFGALINHKGYWNGQQIISSDYLKAATTPASYLKDEDGEALSFYGYQYWLVDYKGKKIPYARGILGQYIFSIEDENAIIVRLGHDRNKQKINHHPTDVYAYLEMGLELLK